MGEGAPKERVRAKRSLRAKYQKNRVAKSGEFTPSEAEGPDWSHTSQGKESS